MKPKEQIENLIKKSKVTTTSETDNRILGDAMEELKNRKMTSTYTQVNIWRVIMRSPISKLAAVAAMIIAVIIGANQFGGPLGGVVFADIVDPILNAHTASFDVAFEFSWQPLRRSHFLCMAPGLMKQTMSDGTINIVDYDQGKLLTLNTIERTANIRNLSKGSKDLAHINILGEMRRLIKQTTDPDNESVKILGRKLVDGREAIGFQTQRTDIGKIVGWPGKGLFTIWADSQTKHPVRLEWYDEIFGVNIVVTNITLDVDIDESIFRIETPEGYTQKPEPEDKQQRQGSKQTSKEEEIINGFRCWASMTNGRFPSSLSVDAIKDLDPNAAVSFNQKGWGFEGGVSFSNPEGFKPELDPNLPHKQIEKELKKQLEQYMDAYLKPAIAGIATVFSLPAGSDWHYNGQDIEFGDRDRPIFWYRPKDSDVYRVIYGDLTVQDATLEDLPK